MDGVSAPRKLPNLEALIPRPADSLATSETMFEEILGEQLEMAGLQHGLGEHEIAHARGQERGSTGSS